MSGEILFLAHRIPWPPNRGDKIRSHHILKYLAKLAPVHVATLTEDADDRAQERELAGLAASYCLADRAKPLALAGVEAVLKGQPVSLPAFHHSKIDSYVGKLLKTGKISTIVVFSSQMAQYVPDYFAGTVIMDFVDVDSAKFESYAETSGWPMQWVHTREGKYLSAYEAQVARNADISLFVSEAEAALFRERSDLGADKVQPLSNGIDTVFYDPHKVTAEPSLRNHSGPTFVFTGQMDYAPNIDAVSYFASDVMPHICKTHPKALFAIVGRNPSDAVKALHGSNGIIVTGAVDDVRGWIEGADIIVAPLRIARGIQNKVLEAMAMAKPVIASPEAAEGIAAQDGVHFVVADGADAQVNSICKMLTDNKAAQEMGAVARAHVVSTMSWDAALAPLKTMMTAPSVRNKQAAG